LPTEQVHQERAGRSQSLFREVNERIEALPNRPPPTFTEYLCECCIEGCTDNVRLTASEYEELRAHPTWFAVVAGHVDPQVERVVNATDRYQVVEKMEQAADVAAHMDPRRREKL
jgi:hypothetical protein